MTQKSKTLQEFENEVDKLISVDLIIDLISDYFRMPNDLNLSSVDCDRMISFFINWTSNCWYNTPFHSKYWIFGINEQNGKLMLNIKGFEDNESFSKTKIYTYLPNKNHSDIDINTLLKLDIKWDLVNLDFKNDFIQALSFTFSKVFALIAEDSKGKVVGYQYSHDYEIGYMYNNQLRLLFKVTK